MELEIRIKKSHVALMRHPETALYSGVMMAGESSVVEGRVTAYTDGLNKRYGRDFMSKLSDEEINAIVLHENLHVALRHLVHNRDLFKEDTTLANMAADYVVNGIIDGLKDKKLCKLPAGALIKPEYANLSMREIYRLLKRDKKNNESKSGKTCQNGTPQQGQGQSQPQQGQSQEGQSQPQDPAEYGGFDEHDVSGPADRESLNEINEAVDRALREGAMLAGRLGIALPRAISDSLEPVVDWRAELMDFVVSAIAGKDEFSWRRYNRRVIDAVLLPTMVSETIGEVVVAIDTSGSISSDDLGLFATELASICDMVNPDRVRVLWWGTSVVGEQIFEGNYTDLRSLLKPKGGGGTRVSSVSEYIAKNSISADAVIVFTDGFVESDVQWSIPHPTLWLVTHVRNFAAPAGGKVVPFNQ